MIVYLIRRFGRLILQAFYSRPAWQIIWTSFTVVCAGALAYFAFIQAPGLMMKFYAVVLLIKIAIIAVGCKCARKGLIMIPKRAPKVETEDWN